MMRKQFLQVCYSSAFSYLGQIFFIGKVKMVLRSKARQARKADNLTAICEPIA
jgi:hypothetical protein